MIGEGVYQVPELVKGDDEANTDPSQAFEAAHVNFDPDVLLYTPIQRTKRTASQHCHTHTHTHNSINTQTNKTPQ